MDSETRNTRAPGLTGEEKPALHGADVCPHWLAPMLDNPLRRWLTGTRRIARTYLRPGMTMLDVGCGSAPLLLDAAEAVGPDGAIICADLQPAMLARVAAKARRAGIEGRVRLHQCGAESLGLEPAIADLAVAFWMLHEVPSQEALLAEIAACLRPGGRFLLFEPGIHVSAEAFARSLEHAEACGMTVVERPRFRMSHTAVLERG